MIGRFSGEVMVSVPKLEEEKRFSEKKLCAVSINFFGISINIFKNYRNLSNECVIIKDNRRASFFGTKKMPFGICREYACTYEQIGITHSESQMADLASERMKNELHRALSDLTLLKIRTDGSFSQDSYVMRSEFVCLGEIGQTLEFSVEK